MTTGNHFLGVKWITFSFLALFIVALVANRFYAPKDASPDKAKFSTSKSFHKTYGVNMSGGEFGESSLPGTINTDYIYPREENTYEYFARKNINVVRLPIRWERVQENPFGPLSPTDLNQIRSILKIADRYDMKVILDLHNFGRYYGVALSAKDAELLSDVWRKLAFALKDEPGLFGYELMNEPHDLKGGSKTWADIAQVVTNEIRLVDNKTLIIIPGYNWQNAQNWTENNPYFPIKDPGKNIIYASHIYFDSTYRGRYEKSFEEDGKRADVGVAYSQDFRNWLKFNNVQGIFTEFGVPNNNPSWLTAMDVFLEKIHKDESVIGAIYWSAGPWWGNYALSIEPINGFDRPQMAIFQKYLAPQPGQ